MHVNACQVLWFEGHDKEINFSSRTWPAISWQLLLCQASIRERIGGRTLLDLRETTYTTTRLLNWTKLYFLLGELLKWFENAACKPKSGTARGEQRDKRCKLVLHLMDCRRYALHQSYSCVHQTALQQPELRSGEVSTKEILLGLVWGM